VSGIFISIFKKGKVKDMIITGMKHFESVCQKKLVEWYNKNRPAPLIDLGGVFIVWSCKTLQNYKCLASTTISGSGANGIT
jgi:hypothetical protein